MSLDETQLRGALNGDPEATTAVLRALDGLIRARAQRIDRDSAEDLAQVGREALWLSLGRFTGSAGQFITFAGRTVTGAMQDAHCAMRYPGISLDEAKLWRSAYKHANGNADEAQRLVCSGQLAWRMSPETAKAVRSAVRPPEALPEDPGAPAPVEPSADGSERSSGRVAWMLMSLGQQQRAVVQMTYGIGESGRMTDEEIAETLGIPKAHVSAARSKAIRRLRDRWSGASFLR
ncbi:RNA polymerase sigma factor [Streptomyces sp. VRA16 Mangrove soil]|uniref:RNA polymerase sigma factor n=1 Tax=Streptomyces sp. VRA16 Mangrove soil TaxID=2817434 RepID=UPI001A9D0601|nr:sigma-70 family RNA polymerase sigma factor [Streptomyces sp. VRA16 Mangrove soil]MBO1333791.1 sigma-70 family RNA polymerase sigma factor [Streptomyces sp. VRA16 Mangrove soil]